MTRSPHRRWKGCCIMCGFTSVRGAGRGVRDPFRVRRQLGKLRRYGRTRPTEDPDAW